MVNKLLTSSILNFATKIFTSLLIFVAQYLLVRYYNQGDLGYYSKLINYANIATVAVGLGLNISSIYLLRKKELLEEEIVIINYATYIILSILLFTSLLLVGYDGFSSAIISIFALFNNMYFVHNAIAQSGSDFKKFNRQNILYAGINILAIILILLLHDKLSIKAIFGLQLFYLSICIILYLKKEWLLNLKKIIKIDRKKVRKFYSYGTRIFITNILGIILYSGDIVLLDQFIDNEQIAVYLVAATGIKLLWIGIDSVGIVLYPEFIDNVKSRNSNHLNKILIKVFSIGLITITMAFICFYYLGKPVIGLVYGENFYEAHPIGLILIVATIGVIKYKFLSRYFAALNVWNPIYLSLVTGIVINWLIIYSYIHEYGIIVAAYSSLIAYFTTGIMILIFYLISQRKKVENTELTWA